MTAAAPRPILRITYYVIRSKRLGLGDDGQPATAGDPGTLLLVSLAGGPKHGYAMMTDVAAFAGVRLGPGTLYGALERLERDGLVEPLASGERRRPYRLTAAGEQLLSTRLGAMGRIIRVGESRLAGATDEATA